MSPREKKILRLVDRYKRLMGLEQWSITVRFDETADEAACTADDEYMRATVSFNLAAIQEEQDASYVRHELLHCLVWELARVAEKLARRNPAAREAVRAALERCTTLLEKMPVWDYIERRKIA